MTVHNRNPSWAAAPPARATAALRNGPGCRGPRRLRILAAVPAVCTGLGAVLAHWRSGPGDTLFMSPVRALMTALAYYLLLIGGVRMTARAVHWLARSYRIPVTAQQAMALTCDTAAPLLLAGPAALVPWLWLHLAVGLAALAGSSWLVWRNVPVALNLSGRAAARFAGAVMVLGAATLVFMVAGTVLLWDAGLAPGLSI